MGVVTDKDQGLLLQVLVYFFFDVISDTIVVKEKGVLRGGDVVEVARHSRVGVGQFKGVAVTVGRSDLRDVAFVIQVVVLDLFSDEVVGIKRFALSASNKDFTVVAGDPYTNWRDLS